MSCWARVPGRWSRTFLCARGILPAWKLKTEQHLVPNRNIQCSCERLRGGDLLALQPWTSLHSTRFERSE